MPGFDTTGPMGMGSMTGRGFGPCFGFGWRHHGHHRGLSRYFCWNHPQTKEDKLKALANYKKALEEELDDVNKEEEEVSKGE